MYELDKISEAINDLIEESIEYGKNGDFESKEDYVKLFEKREDIMCQIERIVN